MVNHYEVHIIFQDTEHQPQENIFNYLLHFNFLQSSPQVQKHFQPTQKSSTGNFCNIAQLYKLFTSQYLR